MDREVNEEKTTFINLNNRKELKISIDTFWLSDII